MLNYINYIRLVSKNY